MMSVRMSGDENCRESTEAHVSNDARVKRPHELRTRAAKTLVGGLVRLVETSDKDSGIAMPVTGKGRDEHIKRRKH